MDTHWEMGCEIWHKPFRSLAGDIEVMFNAGEDYLVVYYIKCSQRFSTIRMTAGLLQRDFNITVGMAWQGNACLYN